MRFVTDGMLGRLTRWLRLLGHDVVYLKDVIDTELLEVAKEEGRILLTKDVALFKKAKKQSMESHLVDGKNEIEKLANIAEHYSIKLNVDVTISRCSTCNSSIREVKKTEIERKVPSTTFETYHKFWICNGCGKIYWQGGHWNKIEEILTKTRMMLKIKNL